MSTVTITQPYRINGIIDTSKSVLENLNNLCTASGCWLTYDISTGKWCVIINKTGTSVASFDDSNIIGSINVSGTGINELYNSVSIEFPHADLRDQKDYIDLEIPEADRFENEIDNKLNIQTDLINDPVTAQYMANVELKQSRVDKIIEFRTDYSKISLKAGDLIDITNSMYGYTNKVFRIIKVEEDDGDTLNISISALEYDANVYSTSGLVRTERTKRNGILIRTMNPAVTASEESSFSSNMLKMLLPLAGTGLLNLLFSKNPLTKKLEATVTGKLTEVKANEITADTDICEGETITFNVQVCTIGCVDYNGVKAPYTITGVQSSDIDVPLSGEITLDGTGAGSLTINISSDADEGTETLIFNCGGVTKTVAIHDLKPYTYDVISSAESITEGQNVTFTITTSGIANGTVLPWKVEGAEVSGSSTGNVTINNNQGSVTVQTVNETSTEAKNLLFTINPGVYNCSLMGNGSKNVVVNNTGYPIINGCTSLITIPISWCGTFQNGVIQSITPSAYMEVQMPVTGQPKIQVPTELSVSGGAISITETIEVDASSGKGGVDVNVIVSGFTNTGTLIKGTTSVVRGFFV